MQQLKEQVRFWSLALVLLSVLIVSSTMAVGGPVLPKQPYGIRAFYRLPDVPGLSAVGLISRKKGVDSDTAECLVVSDCKPYLYKVRLPIPRIARKTELIVRAEVVGEVAGASDFEGIAVDPGKAVWISNETAAAHAIYDRFHWLREKQRGGRPLSGSDA
jgi:hypothetical protein